MSNQYAGGFISKTPPTVTTSSAQGMWTLSQQAQYQKAGIWPKTNADFIGILTGATNENYSGVTVDSLGNTYCCGESNSTAAEYRCVITKYSPVGTLLWQKLLDSVTTCNGYGIAVDSSSNVYVTGTHNSSDRIFLVKYDTSGTLQWQKTIGSVLSAAYDIRLDLSGNIYIAAYTRNSVPTYVASVIKCDSSGNVLWNSELYPSGSSAFARGIVTDSSSNSYMVGSYSGARLGLTKYNSSGTLQWQNALYSNTWNIDASDVIVDSASNIYVCGTSGEAAANGAMIAKYNSSGTLQWKNILQGTYYVYPYSLAVDSSDNIYMCGSENRVSGTAVLHVSKYNSSGTMIWQRNLTPSGGLSTGADGNDIVIDSFGNFVISATTNVSGTNECLIVKLPVDGSLLGSYVVGTYTFTYAASSLTLSTSAATNAASGYSASAGSITASAGALTDATGTLTSTVTII
jgi:hypothetical protein